MHFWVVSRLGWKAATENDFCIVDSETQHCLDLCPATEIGKGESLTRTSG